MDQGYSLESDYYSSSININPNTTIASNSSMIKINQTTTLTSKSSISSSIPSQQPQPTSIKSENLSVVNTNAMNEISSAEEKEGISFVNSKRITIVEGLMKIIKSSWVNVLLIFVPFGMASHFIWSPTVTFILNFLAIIPLAKLLGYATEDIALRTGEIIGGLLNATFGNAVELIISIISLTQNLVVVVQASMLGSILSNLLLVLGMCFWSGGYYHKAQFFNKTVAQTSASLLFISVASLMIPAAFYGSIHLTSSTTVESASELTQAILSISRATSIILLILYFSYLYFQLRTHKHLFMTPSVSESRRASQLSGRNLDPFRMTEQGLSLSNDSIKDENDEVEEPQLPATMAVILLILVTVIIGVCAEFLVSAIEEVTKVWHISETFVGLILIPIVGNAAEHLTAVTCAVKNKMDLALGVAVGSSMQIALLVTPFMVIIGWGMHVDMSLYFNIYETAVLLIAVIMVNYLIMDGESNWLEGLMLMAVYIVIAISFYYYPNESATDSLPSNSSVANNTRNTMIIS
ncbi:Sodium/calcium exchanger protein-domain-containing protein [Mycotypha africana]|uniref:Sodium/calcium exchanger protein-domain-containing protein n=1 Tax=Mycotypha africana TaxID=64632 RepID=UPI0023017F27|nr:Sodium/calcium exchanger protein-domain-containing protein [Mycotypha africana]KAI8967429.1 Sodium/calcium exchanger protein-domain-containing protein [Mycotypha africana]